MKNAKVKSNRLSDGEPAPSHFAENRKSRTLALPARPVRTPLGGPIAGAGEIFASGPQRTRQSGQNRWGLAKGAGVNYVLRGTTSDAR
jgi:hypothetical protein